jgi:hypothetical protein
MVRQVKGDHELTESKDVPATTSGDKVHALVRAGFGAIPVLGAAATELFNSVITPPLERRRVEWMNDVAGRLEQLEEDRALDLDRLQGDDAFITTVMYASQAAIKTHEAEKRAALRNAILNAALPHAPDASLQQHFVMLLDTLTVWHLRILNLLGSNQEREHVTVSDLVANAWPEERVRHDFLKVILHDLNAAGLLGGLEQNMALSGSRHTLVLGDEFLRFVRSPETRDRSDDEPCGPHTASMVQ